GRIVSLSTSPLLDSRDNFKGCVMVVKDETRLDNLERDLQDRQKFHNIIGKSGKMQKIYNLIEDLAKAPTTVLITGESGTGKELIADALHYQGNRKKMPMVKVNCSALPDELLESELFGHVKGAFTGAVNDRIGRFEKANGGTIFLDEIGDISNKMQLRLLRVLQEKTFERVGDSSTIKVDVRIITSTNQNLREKVKQKEFREDLFYRLNVVELLLPPLRDRKDDIPFLTDHFITMFNKIFNKDIKSLSDNAQKIFMNYSWPGNIRELQHSLEHSFVICRKSTIDLDDLPLELKGFNENRMNFSIGKGKGDDRQAIIQALKKTGWNKSKAAQLLGIDRRTVYLKVKKYNISQDDIM
ncbi:MAG: sigma-54 interaction domain-containing protein, partial [Candidatus Anammoxibacter sp.]